MTEKRQLVHEKSFSIAWGDMDALGHVNNGRYFDYFQQARIEWLGELGLSLRKETGPVVIHVNCTYLKPVIYPATLSLKSYVTKPGRSSFWMHYELLQDKTIMAQGESKIVWIDYQRNQSIPFPDVLWDCFNN